MAELFALHPESPQPRRLEAIATALKKGAVMLYPTDTVYAIGCDLFSKSAVQQVRHLKRMVDEKPLTFLCASLSEVSQYARVSDPAFRLMRRLVPGPYTFLLPATKLVPRLVQNPKRKTVGVRVPDRPLCQGLLAALGNPIVSTSAYLLPEEDEAANLPAIGTEKAVLFDRYAKLADLIVDDGAAVGAAVSTIVDLTEETPDVLRAGAGWEAVAALLP